MSTISIIPVEGELTSERYRALWVLLDQDIKSEDVSAIILEFNSGGGDVCHDLGELVSLIRSSPKPILGYVAGVCGSACLWIASQCRSLTASRLSLIGSIGVLVVFDDTSAKLANEGITVRVVATSPEKATGIGGAVVTDEAIAEIQRELAYFESQFHSDLKRGRPQLDLGKVTTGQMWGAHDALSLGLVDAVMPWDEFFNTNFAQA